MSSSFNPTAPKGAQYKPAPLPKTPAAATSDFLQKKGPGYKEPPAPISGMSKGKKAAIAGGIAAAAIGGGVAIKKLSQKKLPPPKMTPDQLAHLGSQPKLLKKDYEKMTPDEQRQAMAHYYNMQEIILQFLADKKLSKKDAWDKIKILTDLGGALAPLASKI